MSLSNMSTRRYITRKPGEAYLDICLTPKFAQLKTCMMWGSISGYGKGLIVIWQK